MKRIMVGLLAGAICMILLATPAIPWEHDPNNPPPSQYMRDGDCNSSKDEGGWSEPIESPGIIPNDLVFPLWYQVFIRHLWIKVINPFQSQDMNHQTNNDEINDNDAPAGYSSPIGR